MGPTILRLLRKYVLRRRRRLTARLAGAAGHTGCGAFDYASHPEGYATFEIALKGVAGTRAAAYLDGAHIADIPIVNGRSMVVGDSRRTGAAFIALPGDAVEIRQHGDVILRGALRNGPSLRQRLYQIFFRKTDERTDQPRSLSR